MNNRPRLQAYPGPGNFLRQIEYTGAAHVDPLLSQSRCDHALATRKILRSTARPRLVLERDVAVLLPR